MAIRLITLGGLRGSLDGAELDGLTSKELSAALLVYIAVERVTTRDVLLVLLWPDLNAESARHRLSQMLYWLRRLVGENAIHTRGREVRATDQLQSDAIEFERAVNCGRVDEAVSLFGGPFLAGVHLAGSRNFEGWVDGVRGRCARLFRRACRTLVEQCLTANDLPGAMAAARAWVTPDPLEDEAQHRLIDLLWKTGDRLEALKQFESYEELLRTEGLEPLDETKELVRRIREAPVARDNELVRRIRGAPLASDTDTGSAREIEPDQGLSFLEAGPRDLAMAACGVLLLDTGDPARVGYSSFGFAARSGIRFAEMYGYPHPERLPVIGEVLRGRIDKRYAAAAVLDDVAEHTQLERSDLLLVYARAAPNAVFLDVLEEAIEQGHSIVRFIPSYVSEYRPALCQDSRWERCLRRIQASFPGKAQR